MATITNATKMLFSSLIGIIAFVVFAAVAVADPGTTWNLQFNNPARFTILNSGTWAMQAVYDRETGRVWEQSPSTELFPWTGSATVLDAHSHCYQLEVGGRKGWRLPSIEELASLVDTSQPSPTLPSGHPFNVNATPHWSSTTNAFDAGRAWAVGFSTGTVFNPVKTATREAWCVRGGQGIDGVQ